MPAPRQSLIKTEINHSYATLFSHCIRVATTVLAFRHNPSTLVASLIHYAEAKY